MLRHGNRSTVEGNLLCGSGPLVTLPSGATVEYEGNITFGAVAGIPSRSVDRSW